MNEKIRTQVEHMLDAELSELSTSPFQRDCLLRGAMEGKKKHDKAAALPHPVRRLVPVLMLVLVLVVTCAEAAAFYPRIISWFAGEYGEDWAVRLEDGDVAVPETSVEVEGAVFTIDEVLVRQYGLYVLGHIRAREGYILVEQECGVDEPFGYNIHYGEVAPEGAQTIAEKATAEGAEMRYVACFLEDIMTDEGTLLSPDCWGYCAKAEKDGSITFSMEVEDSLVDSLGEAFTLVLSAYSWGVKENGTIDLDVKDMTTWTVAVETLYEATDNP